MLVSLTFRISLDCRACHTGMPINGVVPTVSCYHCGEVNALERDFWTWVLDPETLVKAARMQEGADHEITALGRYSCRLAYGRRTPRCQACQGPDLELGALGGFVAQGRCFCPACGHTIRVRAADDLVHAIDPSAQLVVGETALGAEEQKLQARTRPVVFACMGCGGGMPADGSSRAVTCPYCQASNYLPDGLWQQLNPVPKPQVWFLIADDLHGRR